MQQRTEVVDDASWVMGFLDIIDPALDNIKRLFNLEQNSYNKEPSRYNPELNQNATDDESASPATGTTNGGNDSESITEFDLDNFITEKLSLDSEQLDNFLENSLLSRGIQPPRRVLRSKNKNSSTLLQTKI